jgi:hypothetical protein
MFPFPSDLRDQFESLAGFDFSPVDFDLLLNVVLARSVTITRASQTYQVIRYIVYLTTQFPLGLRLLRASLRVCQILLGKYCVLQTFKKDVSSKRVDLQQFDIIYLPNPDLTYIRNPERNKIIFMLFHLLKTCIRNPSLFFISFFTLPSGLDTPMATEIGACIFSRGEESLAKVSIFAKLVCQTVGCQFFLFCQN